MRTYEQWELDELLDKEISVNSRHDDDVAIYRVAAINKKLGITMKFVRQIGGLSDDRWCDACVDLSHHSMDEFNWVVRAIKCGHFDIRYMYKRFNTKEGIAPTECAF